MQKSFGRLYRCLPSLLARRPMQDDRGVTAVEYGLIAFFIVPVIAGTVFLLGQRMGTMFASFLSSFLADL